MLVIESDPTVFFLLIQTRYILDVPLVSTVSHVRSRFAYILGNCGHARSQGGRQAAAAKPPLFYIYFGPPSLPSLESLESSLAHHQDIEMLIMFWF